MRDLRPADDLVRGLLQPRRRRRVDLVLGRLRGHRPERRAPVFSAPLYDEGLFTVDDRRRRHPPRADRPAAAARRAPGAARPRAVADRRRAGRPGARLDRRPDAEAGLDVAPDCAPHPIGFGSEGERAPRRPARTDERRPAERSPAAPAPLFELPDELAIDTDVARRVIGEFIRGQLRQAGFERAVLGLSGGIDSALVAYLVAEAIGARAAAVRADAVPRRRRRRRGPTPRRSSRTSAARPSSSRSARWSTATSAADAADASAAAARQLHGAPADGRAVRPLGDVGRARRRDRQQDRVAHRLHDAVRRLAPARSTRSATCTRARSASSPSPSACPTRSSARRPSADLWPGQTDEIEGGLQLPELDRLLFWRIDKRRSTEEMVALGLRPGDGRAGRPDGRRRPSSSARCRRSPSSGRGRPASTTSTRAAGPARPAVRARRAPSAAPAARCTSSRRRSATSATSRSGRSRSCARSR